VRIETLELVDLRSYRETRLDLPQGITVLVGPNAHGKTNLLEALQRVATGSSHRVAGDGPLVRKDAEAAYVRTVLQTDEGRRRTVEVELRPGHGTRAKVDGSPVRRAADAVGVLRAVLVAPEDLDIVRGDPGERRRFLDELLGQRRPAYAASRSEYERVLRQRNQLLKSARGMGQIPPTLTTWTDQLVVHGAALIAARVAATHALAGPAAEVYGTIADRPEAVTLTYRTSAGPDVTGTPDLGTPDVAEVAAAFRQRLAAVVDEERARGVTLAGPHRDDLELAIGDLPARGYASHGQTWSLALALRVAAYEVLAEVGDRPVVLLDDVFAELDEQRRLRLARACEDWDQVPVTTAVAADVPLEGARVDVEMVGGISEARMRGTT
jgi:DNA replication and repair protein RecF